MTARGSWSLSKGVFARWVAEGLNARFQSAWPASVQGAGEFFAFNDTEARPTRGNNSHPKPYCIFEQGEAIKTGGASGGTSDTIIEYHEIPYQFTVYAPTKALAVEYIGAVADAFDRHAVNLDTDNALETTRVSDFGARVDDETWSWTLQYRVIVEVTYRGVLSR